MPAHIYSHSKQFKTDLTKKDLLIKQDKYLDHDTERPSPDKQLGN